MVNKTTRKVVCTSFSNGKRHDFRVFKESKTNICASKKVIADTGYQGLQKIHNRNPKKRRKKIKINHRRQDKNQKLASHRVFNENLLV